MRGYFTRSFIIFLMAVCAMSTEAQTTISTESGTGYTGNLGIVGGNACVTFGIQNSNPTVRTLTEIDMTWDPFFTTPSANATLWYTTTSLSGPPTITTPTWTQLATANITVAAGGIVPTFTGLSFTLAGNTEYRFAVSTDNGVGYSPAAATPNFFSGDGVTLRTSNFQVAGLNTGYAGAFPSPLNNPRAFTGRIIFVNPAPPCSGTPDPGNTISSVTSICPGLGINLSFQNPIPGSGVLYKWQRSTTGVGGPYLDIPGATSTTLTTSQTVATHYRIAVSCGIFTGNSVPVFVDMAPASNCYCLAASTDVDPLFEKIDNVTFGTLNNSSSSFVGYEDFTSVPPPSFAAGVTAPITVTGNANTYPGDIVKVWIDFNQNGNFNDAGEMVYASPESAGPYTGNITIPATATVGTTRMRIRMYDDIFGNGNSTACGDNTYGQVEDYTINITPCIPGTISSQPVSGTTNCGGTKTFSVTANGTAITYQWQERVNATSPWTIVNNGGIYSGATTATLTLTNVSSASNGHQFQVAVGGPCTPVFLSSVATLTVNPLVATVNALPVDRCAGDAPSAITVTNASGATSTLSVASGPLALAIPETTQDGVNNVINVTTVPAGVNVVGLSVTLNVTHTWAGDLVAVLQGPNGQRINLVALLDGTGGAGPTTGFTNTVISSAGVTALDDAATAPFTGTYAANLYLNPIIGLGAGYYDPMPVGPTGFLPTTANWNDLFSTANGNWTLAIFDGYDDSGAPGQPVNTLNNWSINITYGTPATGVFTPSTGLFTDPAGLIPYTGTAINTVYAAPAASTNYSLVVTTPTCVSAPLTVPVNVNNPITGTSSTTNVSGCIGGSTSFVASAPTSGNNIAHQWKVSTDGGVTYTNVSNNATYSGANTATLTISGLTSGLNGNLYKDSLYVTSCNSSIVTNAGTLTVNPIPTVTLTVNNNGQLYPGLTTTITAASNPNAATYQWYNNGVLVPGATGSTIVVDIDGAGDYTVAVTDVNGCSATSSATSITLVPNNILFIYPSPNTGQFQVRYYNTEGNSSNVRNLSIFDSKGARVYSRAYDITLPYTKMDVDMSNYSKGIYHVELTDRNGKRIKTGSVIIL